MRKIAIAFLIMCAGLAQAVEVQKILFLGNSITLHGPSKKVDWSGNWGMAASAQEKDYVHLVTQALTKKEGAAPETLVKNIAAFERGYATYDAAAQLKDAAAFGADLIVVAIGENVPALTNAACQAEFAEKTVALLKGIKGDTKPLIVVRSCFWASGPKDEALKRASQEIGGVFLDIGALGKDEKNFARSERKFQNAGVGNHPGDKGMQAIADAIIGAVRQAKGSTR